ncbi:MAG TPA: zinc ribbon domain-containing protein [Spirochaetota bacterium]|nr:zinc ribbon domain-containing protein [Spirochaetota bacterium]HOS38673.1 zinc ribbon domain-containing protein [Spirochaetota bacterium]HPI22505.1 zinc ribbon domain-containing protein [Spirochaetota bacterium]HPU87011.1 zinc ribbon domain-containing protein [Spirochaetota bacterium]
MPVYEFTCDQCGIVFSELRRMGDFDPPACPECGSRDTRKIFSMFAGAGSAASCGTCTTKPSGG